MSDAAILLAPGVTPFVEIGVGDSREPVGTAVWQPAAGTVSPTRWAPAGAAKAFNTWVGLEPFWVDVSCYVHEVSTFIGRERGIDVWEVGTASVIVRNVGGWADAPPVSNPLHPLLEVQPGRRIRAGVVDPDSTVAHVLWHGWIDSCTPGYDAEEGEIVTLDCIDAKGEVGRSDVAAVAAAVGAGEFANQRVARILNAVNWPAHLRAIDSSGVALQATTLGEQAVDLLDRAADSSGGGVFGDAEGRVVYRQRDWQVFDPTTPIQGTIGNFGGVDDACPSSWEMSWAREDISTRVLLSRPADTSPVIREDVEDRAEFGVETFERADLETVLLSELGLIADRILEVRSPDYMPRIAAVTLDASGGANVIDALLAADPHAPARFNCQHRSPTDGRTVFSRTMMVVGVEHVLTPETWTARIALDDAAPYMVSSTARWSDGTANVARWNNAALPNALHSAWSKAA